MKSAKGPRTAPPRPLSSVQVDLSTRLGAPAPATPTGLPSLDALLGGGLRRGSVLALTAEPGRGRTTLAVFLAYVAARSKAATLLASVGLDDAEVLARLTARALYRKDPSLAAPYGAIWTGQATRDARLRAPIAEAVEGVLKGVGSYLHLHSADSLEPTEALAEAAARLWTRHERTVLVVDDVEGFTTAAAEGASLEARVSLVASDLARIARLGCAVVMTVLPRHADIVSPAVTHLAELRRPQADAAGARPDGMHEETAELFLSKNRIGPRGSVPITMVPAAAVVDEIRP